MLNKIILMGRLTKDVEARYSNSNTPIASFSIAVDRDFKKDGEKETDFINCTAFNKTAETIAKYFQKGSMIVVVGRIQVRNWKDKEGNNRTSTDVIVESFYFSESKKSNAASNDNSDLVLMQQQYNDFAEITDSDDDLPDFLRN